MTLKVGTLIIGSTVSVSGDHLFGVQGVVTKVTSEKIKVLWEGQYIETYAREGIEYLWHDKFK